MGWNYWKLNGNKMDVFVHGWKNIDQYDSILDFQLQITNENWDTSCRIVLTEHWSKMVETGSLWIYNEY